MIYLVSQQVQNMNSIQLSTVYCKATELVEVCKFINEREVYEHVDDKKLDGYSWCVLDVTTENT